MDEITLLLLKGEPVALVTGRSLDWLIDRVVGKFKERIDDIKLLNNFFVVGEKGGVWGVFENGRLHRDLDKQRAIPKSMRDRVKQLVEDKFSDVMFFDSTKQTMITVEMNEGVSEKKFKSRQDELNRELENILREANLLSALKIDSIRISTDIQYKDIDKGFAAQIASHLIKSKGFKPQKFMTFGDIKSDVQMAQRLHKEGFAVEFVFLGDSIQFEEQNFPFPIILSHSPGEKGTLEYLKSQPVDT